METIPNKDFDAAEVDRVTWQNQIETAGEGANIIARTQNVEQYTAFILPTAREAEYDAATTADKLRFVLVCQRTLQRTNTGELTFLTVFEEEYQKEFG